MNTPKVTPQFLLDFTAALKQFSDEGYILRSVPAGRVEVGDYLVSYFCEFESDGITKLRTVRCAKVVATGYREGSGPQLSQQTIALEGDSNIQHYQDDPELLIVRKQEPL